VIFSVPHKYFWDSSPPEKYFWDFSGPEKYLWDYQLLRNISGLSAPE
jgi:hypothetical protein